MEELGIFCGTFNPIHMGHLLMAECARDQFQLQKVLFVTSAQPPHRPNGLLEKELRHQMVIASIQDNPEFEDCCLEVNRVGLSYTIDTLKEVQKEYGPNVRLNLILGEDNLPYLKQWRNSEQIFQMCRLLVAPRVFPSPNPKYGSQRPGPQEVCEAHIEMLDFPLVSISASNIRERCRQGRSVRYMVAPAAYEILMTMGHYKDG